VFFENFIFLEFYGLLILKKIQIKTRTSLRDKITSN